MASGWLALEDLKKHSLTETEKLGVPLLPISTQSRGPPGIFYQLFQDMEWAWWGGGSMKSLRRFFFFCLPFFFLSCTWLIQQADGKYWAIYLTTLFLNFLVSNVGLFVCSFEICASTQNVSVDIQFRYCISNWCDVSPVVETPYIRLIWSGS